MTPKSQILVILAAGGALVAAAFAAPPPQGGRKFTTTLSGANECNAAHACNLGDPDGTGTADIEVNVGQQRVCWQITVNNITAPMRGHIHKGPAGGAGGIVVPFFEPSNVNLNGCTSTTQPVDRRLLMDIIQHPQDYYVNVHTTDFPAGAIRGQLGK